MTIGSKRKGGAKKDQSGVFGSGPNITNNKTKTPDKNCRITTLRKGEIPWL
jgi:hypothetical protein